MKVLFCSLGFSVLVSRVLVHIEKNKSLVCSSERDLHCFQDLQLGAREDEVRERIPHTRANDSFFFYLILATQLFLERHLIGQL